MTNEIAKTPNGTVLSPDLAARLMSGIAESRAMTQLTGGKHFLRFLKDGSWVYGQSNEEVLEHDQWAVNIMSLSHGWVCWQDNSKVGEIMTSMLKPLPACPEPVNGVPYKEQRGFELRGVSGDVEGIEVLHNMNSQGGLRDIDRLLAEIHKQLRRDPQHPCPVVVLGSDSYQNKKYGLTYTPVYEIVTWCDMDGNVAEGTPEAVAAPAPAPAPRVVASAPAAAPAPVAAPRAVNKRAPQQRTQPFPYDEQDAVLPPPAQPVATAQLHTGQRRRPPVTR